MVDMLRRLGAPVLMLMAALAGAVHAQQPGAPATPAPQLPQTPAQWRQAAIDDIQAAYQLTYDNHPGVYDAANPRFAPNLALARERGLALAARVSDGAGYQAALFLFNAQIHDGHAGAMTLPAVQNTVPWRWPGFVAVWRGDAMYVYAAEAGGPPAGARIDQCDGKGVRELAETNVFTYIGRSEEPGSWWKDARLAFIDLGNPFVELPKQCSFTADGKPLSLALTWRATTAQMNQWLRDSNNGGSLPVGVTEPRAGLLWVAMPTFQPDEQQRATYRAMNRELRDHRQRYLDADAVVIDLRENLGGSSLWSLEFAGALWGEARVNRRNKVRAANQQVWWRASAGNTAYVGGLVEVLKQQKQDGIADEIRKIAAGMQASLARGDKFFATHDDEGVVTPEDRAENLPDDPPAFTKPVYVIVPGQCASACLDALDYFTMFPNTKLIGAPTEADSTYMEIRMQPLASGLATVIIPNKVYVNRPRAAGQFYTPAIAVNDLDWSQQTFLKTIEADLRKR